MFFFPSTHTQFGLTTFGFLEFHFNSSTRGIIVLIYIFPHNFLSVCYRNYNMLRIFIIIYLEIILFYFCKILRTLHLYNSIYHLPVLSAIFSNTVVYISIHYKIHNIFLLFLKLLSSFKKNVYF